MSAIGNLFHDAYVRLTEVFPVFAELTLGLLLFFVLGGIAAGTGYFFQHKFNCLAHKARKVLPGSKWIGLGSEKYAPVWHVEDVSHFGDYCAIRLQGASRAICVSTDHVIKNMKPLPEPEASA